MYSWYSCSILLKQKGGNLAKSDRRGGGRRYEWVMERGVEREDLKGRKKKCRAWDGSGKG